ncbi:MAG: hypothetical protein A3C61_01615 [Candidatus Yanofskybacteria bacterium RIFCSPHIGHO2_02_FULL_39_10]|uniref:Uncharacterized protein n=1 Tax=Candidatus Yanofskybacteria bacterium RIFCSPHIGHO2_02_FULL_39_10 TaxID=1802674 RepID=A0A1F8FBH6_9BACT|nr:MAG: hypothetical protein A3C61_01615 [Candidatus Yanofskybacteria bacterium RIFCSPHIGHO2_02_FULL_39_10]
MRNLNPIDASVLAIIAQSADSFKKPMWNNLRLLIEKDFLPICKEPDRVKKVIYAMRLVYLKKKLPENLKSFEKSARGLLKWAENNRTIHSPRRS